MNSTSPILGIDFGTSTSKMAWYNPKTNQAEILRNAEGEEQTPSVVYFGESEMLVGTPAEAMLEYEQERERVIISIKRELTTTPVVALPGRSVKPVEVAAEILHKLKRDAEELHFQQEVTRVVVTYPASFGPLDRDKIREATRLAGFTEVEMVEEPVAAAIAYTQMGLKVGKYVLVYDLGGGTFDLAVLVCDEDGFFRLALDPQGIKQCGGDDFDEALYNHCDRIAREKLGRPISLTAKRDLHFLSECRQRKENLSSTERRMFKSLLEPGAVLFQHEIDRVTFERLISPTVEETVRKTVALLEQANAEGYKVDTVVLVGGSTRVPLAQRLLNENLSLKAIPWQHRDVAVAFGAAYQAQNKWGGLGSEKTHRKPKAVKPETVSPPKQRSRQSPRKSEDFTLAYTLTGHLAWVQSVTISPDGQMIASSGYDKTIKLWDLRTGALLRTFQGHSDWITSVVFSPDGQMLASGSDDATIKLRNLPTGALLRTIQGYPYRVSSVAFSPDGQMLASGSYYGAIKLLNLPTGALLRTLQGNTDWITSVVFSPDGQMLASGSYDKTIKLWKPHTGELLHSLQGHSNGIRSVGFSSDGQMLASGSRDQTIKLWNPRTTELLRTLTGHSGGVESVAISPNGQTLASGGADGIIKLWDLPTGQLLCTLTGHLGWVESIAISPDGQILASGSRDKTLKIWRKT